MLLFKKKTDELDEAIERILLEMKEVEPDTERYHQLMDTLERLSKVERKRDTSRRINPNTLFIVGGNLLGILTIVNYERMNVIGSRALGFILKSHNTNNP